MKNLKNYMVNKIMDYITNKLADYQDFNQIGRRLVIERLLKAKFIIDQTGLPYSDHMQDNWLRLWEYSGAIINSYLDRRMKVLEAGGTGTVFSYYMAMEGCEVHTIDLSEDKVKEAEILTAKLGLNMRHTNSRIEDSSYPDCFFDAIYSICVIEHNTRETQKKIMENLARMLKHGGVLTITFGYGEKAPDTTFVDYEEIRNYIIYPSGLFVLGNPVIYEKSNDLFGSSIDYTFGAITLQKEGKLELDRVNLISIKPSSIFDSAKDIDFGYYGYCEGRSSGGIE